jgi:8-oxo-dGTP pyrophosphatase MutT (NUDIX family)
MSDYVRGLRERIGHDLLFVPSAAVLIRDGAGRVLLVRNHSGAWTYPAGQVDPGETPAAAAAREAREEASIDVEIERIAGVFGGYPDFHGFYPNGDEMAYVVTVFEARIADGAPAPGDDETAEVGWFAPADAFELELSSGTRHVLEAVLAGRSFDP